MEKSEKIVDIETKFSITVDVLHKAFIEKLDEFMESHNKEEENQDEQIPQE